MNFISLPTSNSVRMALRKTRQTTKELSANAHRSHSARPDSSSESEASDLTLADIQRSIQRSSANVCSKLDSLSNEVASIKQKMSNLEDSVSMNSDKLVELEQRKIPEVEKKMADEITKLQDKLTLMEIYGRRTNLLFYGVDETQNEHVDDVLRDTFIYLGLDNDTAANIALVNAHRLPRRDSAAPSQASGEPSRDRVPRAIIAKFVYMRDRNKILAAFEERQRQRRPRASNAATPDPDPRRITVRTDLPPALKAKRSALAKAAYNLRKEKHVSTKIQVVGSNVHLYWKEKGTTNWNLFHD